MNGKRGSTGYIDNLLDLRNRGKKVVLKVAWTERAPCNACDIALTTEQLISNTKVGQRCEFSEYNGQGPAKAKKLKDEYGALNGDFDPTLDQVHIGLSGSVTKRVPVKRN
jgi:hypothetical protein